MKALKKKLLVIGAGDYSKIMGLYLLDDDSKYRIVAFVDDFKSGKSMLDIPIIKMQDIYGIEYDCITITADIQQTHKIIKTIIKMIPDFFDKLIENPLYNDTRVASFQILAEEIERKRLCGSVAELGVYKGDFAKHICKAFPDRDFYLFDTFEGFDKRDIIVETTYGYSNAEEKWFSDTNMQFVYEKLSNFQRCKFIKGYFPESIIDREDIDDKFVFVNLDVDLYNPIYEGLCYFYPRLVRGGYIYIHDYHLGDFQGVKKAVDDYSLKNDISIVPIFDFGGSAVITK